MKFQNLACSVHKIWHASDFILILSKEHNSRKGDNSVKKKKKKKKNVCQLFFQEESIYKISKHARFLTNGRTHGQPETNMPRQLLRSWGHNNAFS